VLIGPEGDFSTEELESAQQLGFEKVSLGENRLRTETAGLIACQIFQFVNT
jgi:16S rRNA (uracil1498-N3)-methyltransferase